VTNSPSPVGRPAGSDGEQTRARIISAAIRCVATQGCSRATIREIARVAEMTSGSLYHYFPNKAELLGAAVEHLDSIASPRLRAAAQQADDVVGRLEAALDEAARLLREHPHIAAFDRAIRTESAAHRGDAGLTVLRDTVEDIVQDPQARNAIHALTRGLTDRAAALEPEAFAATVRSAKDLVRGTLFVADRPSAPRQGSTARRRAKPGP
jgi:AcrR family transcriptional regulator